MADTYLTRETLLKRLKSADDELSWEEFIHYYRRFIFSIFNKMRISDSDSDDLFQRVLLKVWKAIPNFDYNQAQGQFRSWLYKVTQNTVLNFISEGKIKKQNVVAIDEKYSKPEVDRIIRDEWEKHISALAFNTVKEKVSEVAMQVFLASLEGEKTEVTAKKYGLSENSVYVYKMRVKNALTAEIKNLRDFLE